MVDGREGQAGEGKGWAGIRQGKKIGVWKGKGKRDRYGKEKGKKGYKKLNRVRKQGDKKDVRKVWKGWKGKFWQGKKGKEEAGDWKRKINRK